MNDVTIYIPSRGRAALQRTWAALPRSLQKITRIIVPEEEVLVYQSHDISKNRIIEGCPKKGIGKTRQYIIDSCPTRYCIMLDDDLYFYRRQAPKSIRLVGANHSDLKHMLHMMVRPLKNGFVASGLASRVDSSHYLCSYRVCTRVNNAHGFDVKALKKTGIRFDEYKLMEDFHVTISLLQRGYPNASVYDYCWNQPGSNTEGGCSIYRTLERQKEAAEQLHAAYPQIVKVVTKQVRGATSWEGMKERTDVRINWRKAFKGTMAHWQLELMSSVNKLKNEGII